MKVSPEAFLALAQSITHKNPSKAKRTAVNRFVSTFGSDPYLVAEIWDHLQESRSTPHQFRPIHLLWTLSFLKLYNTEAILSSLCGCDEKTLRKWVWVGIDSLSGLDLVSWHRGCAFHMRQITASQIYILYIF